MVRSRTYGSAVGVSVDSSRVQHMLGVAGPKLAEQMMAEVVKEIADDVAKDTKRNMGRRFDKYETGQLEGDVTTHDETPRNGVARSGVYVAKKSFYWRFLEFGTKFLRPFRVIRAAIREFGHEARQKVERKFAIEFARRLSAKGKK